MPSPREETVTVTLSLVEARALLVAMERGLEAIKAFGLVKNPALIEEAVRVFRSNLPGR